MRRTWVLLEYSFASGLCGIYLCPCLVSVRVDSRSLSLSLLASFGFACDIYLCRFASKILLPFLAFSVVPRSCPFSLRLCARGLLAVVFRPAGLSCAILFSVVFFPDGLQFPVLICRERLELLVFCAHLFPSLVRSRCYERVSPCWYFVRSRCFWLISPCSSFVRSPCCGCV